MTTRTTTIHPLLASKRVKSLATKSGSASLLKSKLPNDLSDLRPEDVLSLFHSGKLSQKDTMFWLGVLVVAAEEKAKKHEAIANVDELTQVANRRAFIDTLSQELNRLRSKHLRIQSLLDEPMTLSLMIVDIDKFKKINDTYGHLAGDEALKELAKLLKKEARGTDSVFRYGGEEFVILLPDTDVEDAVRAAERINQSVAKSPFTINRKKGKKVKLTVSVGVSHVNGSHLAKVNIADMFIPRLIARADEALYQAKETGRNKVVLWKPKTRKKTTKK